MRYPNVIDIKLTEHGRTRKLTSHEAKRFFDLVSGKPKGQQFGIHNTADTGLGWEKYDGYQIEFIDERDPFVCHILEIEPSYKTYLTLQRLPDGDFEHRPGIVGADTRKDDGSYYLVADGRNTIAPPKPKLPYAGICAWVNELERNGYRLTITEYPAKSVKLQAP